MAKPMKKKTIIKAASKPAKKPVAKATAKTPAKPAKKPAHKALPKAAAKSAPIKKKMGKAHSKIVAKAPVKVAPKKGSEKTLEKAAPKVLAKKAAPASVAPQKKQQQPVKEEIAKITKKVTPTPAEKPLKKETKAAGKKGKAPAKKDDEELEDEFIADDDLGHDEIGEYEEELKAVESLDEESDDVVEWAQEPKDKVDEEIYLTDAEGRRYCRARDCDQAAAVDVYCRYHYLLLWKKIQVRKRILLDGKLERYIEELTARYPDKFLEMIRRDLRTEKDFLGAIQELEIDESNLENDNEEDTQSFIEEVRGMEGTGSGVEDEEF